MAAKKETYAEAIKRLEGIVARIESNELDIDQLGENLKEAQKLPGYETDRDMQGLAPEIAEILADRESG